MSAGTIAVLGQTGAGAGIGMRRGTLLLAQAPEPMSANFSACGVFEPAMMPLIERYVAEYHRPLARRLAIFRRAQRWAGDMAYGGVGEMLIAE